MLRRGSRKETGQDVYSGPLNGKRQQEACPGIGDGKRRGKGRLGIWGVALCMTAALTACGEENRPPEEGLSSAADMSAEASESGDASGQASEEPKDTQIPEQTPEPETDPAVTVYGELSSVGQYAPAETYSRRGLVAVKAENGVFVSWRSFGADSDAVSFTLERNGTLVYSGPLTNYLDTEGRPGDAYRLTASEGISSQGEETLAWEAEYQEFVLKVPEPQMMPDASVTHYTANDMSVGDLDGDGELELVVKWYPDNAQDNSKDGYTGTTFLDAYDIDIASGDARLMWRIDLGLNIRSGAHYTQFQVWDYDGDGRAELICKTADGTTTYDGNLQETGHVGAVSMGELNVTDRSNPTGYDFRLHSGRLGRIVKGQEYLTAFDGETGSIVDTVEYIPARGPYDEASGTWDTSNWGLKNGVPAEKNDGYANRADRFLSATAYLDEGSACAVFARGYYGRTAITAWKLIDGKLEMKWAFDAPNESKYAAQGNHGLSVNDVDGDGLDEIIYGSLTMDDDGTPLYVTGLGHGDAMHVSDWNGDGRLEVFQVHEEAGAQYHVELHDAKTGEILWGYYNGKDTGRGVAADIDPRYPGAEMWCAVTNVTYDCQGNIIYEDAKPSQNFSIFWDGDLLMELFDYDSVEGNVPQVQKWDYENLKTEVLLEAQGAALNNGTKGNAGLVADIYGDWREEFIVRDRDDSSRIRIYSTAFETEYVFPCLLEDRAYREGVAWQNVAYNQPANLTVLLSREPDAAR